MLIACVPCLTQGAWGQAEEPNFGGVSGRRAPSGAPQTPAPATWLEAIEIYTLPWDPHWQAAAESAEFPGDFRESAREAEEARMDLERRSKGSSSSSPAMKALIAKEEKLLANLRVAASREMPLTVIRAWDGIKRAEVVLTLGRGQRALAARVDDRKPFLAVIDVARPGDDLQARRRTVGEIRPSSSVPSEFLRVEHAPVGLLEAAFGEVMASELQRPASVTVRLDGVPGSGVLLIELAAPPEELQIDLKYPWYAEFRLHELQRDGTRAQEVRFDGPSAIIAVGVQGQPVMGGLGTQASPPTARGRVEVKSPKPWGYEVEIVKWFGVAPKHRLVADSARATEAGAKPSVSGDKTMPRS